eukprot:PITA_33019
MQGIASTSTSMGLFNPQFPQFNGKSYDYWEITMKAMFACQDIWEIVQYGFEEPTDENEFNRLTEAEKDLLKSNRKKDSKALVFLYQAMAKSVFPRIAAAKTSKEAWKTLKTTYQGMEKVKTTKLQLVRRDFENLNMKESDNIDSFFTHVIGLVTQMRTHGEVLEERRIVEKLLRVLPSKFDVIVTTIEETKDLSNFSVDELLASLITHEQRLSRNENSSLEKAFKTQMSFGRGRGLGRGNKRGRGRSQNKGGRNIPANAQGQGSSQQSGKHHAEGQRYEKSNVQCHYCKKYGHYANECKKKQHDMSNSSSANITRENISTNNVLLVCNMVETNSEDIRFLDFGCSNHMTGNIALFSALDQSVKSQVTLGTDSKISVMGKGEIKIFTKKEKPDSLCEGCILGKQHRESFPSGKSIRAKAPIEIFHSDVCGPMQTPSLAGNQYFLTFIDDFTRKTWIYFLKNKSEVFEKFQNFKALVENQCGLHIKVLRTDRGGEYIPKEFLRFCRENGIHKQFTARYTPQQNGVAERKNRTIMDMARSMLKAKHLPNDYWAEAVNCATYI